jgi:hypothetical protein
VQLVETSSRHDMFPNQICVQEDPVSGWPRAILLKRSLDEPAVVVGQLHHCEGTWSYLADDTTTASVTIPHTSVRGVLDAIKATVRPEAG